MHLLDVGRSEPLGDSSDVRGHWRGQVCDFFCVQIVGVVHMARIRHRGGNLKDFKQLLLLDRDGELDVARGGAGDGPAIGKGLRLNQLRGRAGKESDACEEEGHGGFRFNEVLRRYPTPRCRYYLAERPVSFKSLQYLELRVNALELVRVCKLYISLELTRAIVQ